MLDLQELLTVAQLVDNMNIIVEKVEDAYRKKDGAGFKEAKQEIINSQKKISQILSEEKKEVETQAKKDKLNANPIIKNG